MLRFCVTLAVLGCAFAAPRAQHQYQTQTGEGIPSHLLRQYLSDQGPPAQTQVIPRITHVAGASPSPARFAFTAAQEDDGQYRPEPQYQQQPQYQPQPQAQQQQYRPQPQYQAKPQKQTEDYDPNPSYQFGFDVNDDQYTNYQNRKEERDGDVIKGSYSVVDSDGFIRTVTYTADPKEGFKAEVSRQPTDIVVKIPTPKPQTLQQPQQYKPQPQPQQYQPQPQQYQPQPQQYQSQPQQYQPQQRPQAQQSPQQFYRYDQ